MEFLLFYCRAGFEGDLAKEVQDKAAKLNVYGYPKLKANTGYMEFHCYQSEDARKFANDVAFNQLIFARQMIVCVALVDELDPSDRLGAVVEVAETLPLCGDILVEYPDTTDGRELSKFCRKFTVPARQALRKAKKLTDKAQLRKSWIHLFFTQGTRVYVGFSPANNRSTEPLGILRLKFPADAPSRSTLKLDEAFQVFLPKEERESRAAAGMHAVDLGACPGGWTYQLVKRGMFVQAIDNGAMDEALMETGQVKHFAEDGFKYLPKKKNVTWLVCDMIEQPQRVAELMASWLVTGWCKETIFNLKLPMKRRYESVTEAFAIVDEIMDGKAYRLQAKHLYHDREEITVHMCMAG